MTRNNLGLDLDLGESVNPSRSYSNPNNQNRKSKANNIEKNPAVTVDSYYTRAADISQNRASPHGILPQQNLKNETNTSHNLQNNETDENYPPPNSNNHLNPNTKTDIRPLPISQYPDTSAPYLTNLNNLELTEIRNRNQQLQIQLAEAYNALKFERSRSQQMKDSHIQLEQLAKKLEGIAIRERQRANKLEDELISQSHRKSGKKGEKSA